MSDSKKSILNHSKLVLTAPKLNNGSYPPKLKIQTYNNNVQIAVFSGVDSAKASGIINAGMDPFTFYNLLAMIERICSEPTPTDEVITYKIENDQGRGKDKTLKSTTVIGKDTDGVVFISVIDADPAMPKVKFNFNADFYHRISIPGVDKGGLSQLAAKAWVDALRNIMAVHLTTTYEPVKFNPGGKPGGNEYKGSPVANDDEMPW